MNNRLTTKQYWDPIWRGISLPIIASPGNDVGKKLEDILPKSNKTSFLEVGCSPGKWMAYFNKHFTYFVNGIEYIEEAVDLTKRNLELQKINANVLNLDFLKAEISPASYDVVFSDGFIEHFEDLEEVVGKICLLAKKYVITIVPNLYGLDGFIGKVTTPKVFSAHKRIDINLLRQLHEKAGLNTVFCNYVHGIELIMPADTTRGFFSKNRKLAYVINLPFRTLNYISRKFSIYTNIYPRTKYLSSTLMYIGVKSFHKTVKADV